MSRFENFTPPTLGSELTSSEISMVQSLNSLANSSVGQFVRKESGSFVNATLSETLTLAGLSDVEFSNLATNEFPRYNGSSWVNSTLSDYLSLNGLSDVVLSSPVSGHVLRYNGSEWSNSSLADMVVSTEVPAGTVNGSNTTFTVSNTPKLVVVDGLIRRENFGYTFAGSTITVDSLTPPAYDIFTIY